MKTRFFTLLMVVCLLTAAAIPAVSAETAPLFIVPAAVSSAPATTELVIGGITVVMTGIAALKIAENLGKAWDNTQKGWDQLMKDTGAALDSLFHAKKWIQVTSLEGQAVMNAIYECYSGGGSGGKKDDKWYFEARLNHGKIEINTDRMDETQALKEMGRGKNIMTLNEKLAQNLVGRFKGLSEAEAEALKSKFEGTHNPAAGKFLHLHYEAHGMRLHCWSWK